MISGTDDNRIASFHQRTTLGLTFNYLVHLSNTHFDPITLGNVVGTS